MSETNKYEETINYPALLLMQINDVRLSIQNGNTGEVELEGLYMLLADDLKADLDGEIIKINDMYIEERQEKLASWSIQVGHPSNNIIKTNITISRQIELNRLRALANQLIVNKIINMLYKKDMLLTPKSSVSGRI